MFKNKTVIVTGAAKGIGYGIASAFAKQNANVVISDLNMGECEKASKEISKATKANYLALVCDVSKKENVDTLIQKTLEKFGELHVFVNNAGIYPFKPFMEMTEADWNKVIDVNLKGTFLCSQAAANVMKAGGKIVDISSIAAFVGFEGLTHYCASKGGMNGMIRAMALELASKKINVNAVAPGAIETPGATGALADDAMKQTIAAIPWKRMGQPEDIANAAVFLASDGADYITGQVLVVDGGWTLR